MHRGLVTATAVSWAISVSVASGETPGLLRVESGRESAQVRRNRFNAWHELTGEVVPAGQELTCEHGCRIKIDGDASGTLAPGAIVSVTAPFYPPLGPHDKAVRASHLEVRSGKIEARSPADRPLVVSSTTGAHLAFQGGSVQVAALPDHMAVRVDEGSARATAHGKWMTLEKGQSTSLRAQGGPSEPGAGVAAPAWTSEASCPRGLVVAGLDTTTVGGCWKPAERAVSYVVEASSDSSFSAAESVTTNATSWSKTLAGTGSVFLRVRAVDEDGLVSESSVVRHFGAVAVAPPPGSKVDAASRTMTVPQGRSLELAQADDLDIALDAGAFVPATRFVVMDSVSRHVVRMRYRDDRSSEGVVVLQRRALQADVAFSPRLAHWPQDSIDITVSLSDKSGVVDVSQVAPKIHVLVGVTEIALDWARRGPVWTAKLRPQSSAPTVVRVIAEDEFGTMIGRNFVEVDQGGSTASGSSRSGYVAHN